MTTHVAAPLAIVCALAMTPPGTQRAPVAQPAWMLKIAMTELATAGTGPDVPYALQASARLDAMRAGAMQPVFVKRYHADSSQRQTTAEWSAKAQLAPDALDGILATLAAQMAGDMVGPGLRATTSPRSGPNP